MLEARPHRSPAPMPRAVRKAVELLAYPDCAVSLGDLASRVGLSKFHLSRLFTRYTGYPPLRFRNERRLQAAAELLRAGSKPVDVAYALGFADQSHFGRLFKRRFGLPPCSFARSAAGRRTEAG